MQKRSVKHTNFVAEAVVRRCSVKKRVRKIHKKTPVSESSCCNFIKIETPTEVFSYEILRNF